MSVELNGESEFCEGVLETGPSEWDDCDQCDKCGALTNDLIAVGDKRHCLRCESAFNGPKRMPPSPLFAKVLQNMGPYPVPSDVAAFEYGEFWGVATRKEGSPFYVLGSMELDLRQQLEGVPLIPRLFTARDDAQFHLEMVKFDDAEKIELVRVQWSGALDEPLVILFPSVDNNMVLGMSDFNVAMTEF